MRPVGAVWIISRRRGNTAAVHRDGRKTALGGRGGERPENAVRAAPQAWKPLRRKLIFVVVTAFDVVLFICAPYGLSKCHRARRPFFARTTLTLNRCVKNRKLFLLSSVSQRPLFPNSQVNIVCREISLLVASAVSLIGDHLKMFSNRCRPRRS